MNTPDGTRRLAVAFLVQLRKAMNKFQWCDFTAKAGCQTYPPSAYASHDHLDANSVMSAAFLALKGRDPDLEDDRDVSLWTASWNLAVAMVVDNAAYWERFTC